MGAAGYHGVRLLSRHRTPSEIHRAGARECRVFKEFRRRLNYLTPRDIQLPRAKCEIHERFIEGKCVEMAFTIR